MKEKILKLRAEGKTYTQIQKELGCSKGTISYHCSPKGKAKAKERTKKFKEDSLYILRRKVDTFLGRVLNKEGQFAKVYKKRGEKHKKFVEKIVNNPYCYLTGKRIDLTDGSTYQLDHITPFHINQDNSIDNMGLLCREANAAKAHMTLDEFYLLCEKVLEHRNK